MKQTTGGKRSTSLLSWVDRLRRRRRQKSAEPKRDWRWVVRRRVMVGGFALALWAAGIEGRLIYLQIYRHDALVARAENQQNRSNSIPPKRGEILDRNGQVLAYSVDADTIMAVPTEVENATETAALVCGALDNCQPTLLNLMEQRLRRPNAFAYMSRQVSPAEARRVTALGLEGIGIMKADRRYYPNKELAAHLIGFVGIDNQGLGGIESTYDREISGRAGRILIQRDSRLRAFSTVELPPTTGATLELTIDKYLQYIAERELRLGVREHAADGGTVVILDPHTGEVLALANEPTFNPNVFANATKSARRNRAVQDIYEPGSTFKIVTASAAFDEQVIERDEVFDVSTGSIAFGGRVITDLHTYDKLSFTDVIVKSSNVGTIMVGLRLGPERLSRYVRRFGFGQALSPDFPGENRGIVWNPARLDESALASMSMGYQVSVTPLQMASATSAVANGGELVMPRVVRAIVHNGLRSVVPRQVIRRAISKETAAELTSIMEAVVERGTGRAAQIPGYIAAGKTGTAEKLVDKRYSDTDHNSSFVGFVPSRRPVMTILVMIDTPRGNSSYGGVVAAPIFRRIAEASLRHLAIPSTINPRPQVLVSRAPRPVVASVSVQHRAPVVLRPPSPAATDALMPDLRGMSGREALKVLGSLGLDVRLVGSGFVVSHQPGPGAMAERGSTSFIRLSRDPSASSEGNR